MRVRSYRSFHTYYIIILLTFSSSFFLHSCSRAEVYKDPRRVTKIIAHRGYWRTEGSFENSLASIENAARIGVDGIEFDVWTTSDDIPVVHHDKLFSGMDITSSRYSDLKVNLLPNGERLPTLSEYLRKIKEFPDLIVFLEIEDLKAAELAPQVVKKEKLKNQVIFISFMKYACDMLLSADRTLNVGLLVGASDPYSPAVLKEEGFSGIDYSYDCFQNHPNLIKEAKDSKLFLSVWTVNSESDYEWAYMNGFDFITTDRPDLFVHYSLSDSKYWSTNR